MPCNCLHLRRQRTTPMLYDNLAITATTRKDSETIKLSKSQIERQDKSSVAASRLSDEPLIFAEKLERYSSYKNICESSPRFDGVDSRDGLQTLFQQHLQHANDAERQFEQRGKSRRAYQRTTRFLSTFKTYMDAYGGVVEMMASAGGAYGYTAYNTMSIFLTIAANKQDRDDKISEIVDKLCKYYARFPTLARIHPTSDMEGYLAEACKVGIDFARYASLYYLKSSIARLWDVIFSPPELFEETLRDITEAMQDVKDETAFRDSERLHRVEETMEQNQVRIEASHKQIQDAQRDAQLEALREKILPNYAVVTQETSDYQARLQGMFDGQRRDVMERLPELQQCKDYRGWQARGRSSILVLRGEARQETHFSWFSPLIMAMCRNLQQEKAPVAFHCCQPHDIGGKGHRFVDVLNHLSFQLLYTMARPLHPDSYKSIRDASNKTGLGKDPALAISVLSEIIRNLDLAFLIVDRADMMRGDWEGNLGLLCRLASKKASGGCVVKILLLGSRLRSDWRDIEANMADFVGTEAAFELTCAEEDWSQ